MRSATAALQAATALGDNCNNNADGSTKRIARDGDASAFGSLPGRRQSSRADDPSATFSYCTGGRRKRRAAVAAAAAGAPIIGTGEGGGLSSSLSTESIRNACDFYRDVEDEAGSEDDELSDDDLIEVQRTPAGFHSKQPPQQASPGRSRLRGRRNSDESPLCLALSPTPPAGGEEDPMSVLDELDAILDSHSALPLPEGAGGEEAAKVADCLLDLDNYLEELDDSSVINDDADEPQAGGAGSGARTEQLKRHRTLSLRRNSARWAEQGAAATIDAGELRRGAALRQTVASGALQRRPAQSATAETGAEEPLWRRQSMRHTDTLQMPAADSAAADPAQTPEPLAAVHRQCSAAAADEGALRRCLSQRAVANDEPLTQEDIFQNLLLQSSGAATADTADRPRQLGRRAAGHPRILSLRCAASEPAHRCTLVSHERRPLSAPAAASGRSAAEAYVATTSEASSVRSSHNASPISLALSTSDSSTTTASSTNATSNMEAQLVGGVGTPAASGVTGTPFEPSDSAQTRAASATATPGHNAKWPHDYSRTLALLCCTLGLFNVCRFAVLTAHYGGNFLLQFLLLSIVFGIPLLWLQMCLGAKIRAGPVSMWKISPICRGIGVALVLVQCLMAIYSTVAIAWLLIYLRDVLPSSGGGGGDVMNSTLAAAPVYRWQDAFYPYRQPGSNSSTANITECVADYFNVVVLQRLQLQFARRGDGTKIHFRVNDRLAFNLAILWTLVFLVLCKGLRSFGRLVFPLATLPLLTLCATAGKLLSAVDLGRLQSIITAADFDDFLINAKTWTAAAQETFLTWGLLGASVVAIASRSHSHSNAAADKTALRRDAILVVLLTLLGLVIAALLGLCSAQILAQHDYIYVPGSYEHPDSYLAVYSLKSSLDASLVSFPPKWVPHYSSFVGETYRRPTTVAHRDSGYQALRFVSELFPAVAALAGEAVAWPWIAATLAALFTLGLAQLCAMWKPISSALGNSTSSVLLSCVTGLLLSIPFATEMGIAILHYCDLLLGGAWFVPLLWTAQIFGVFLIRGRPYNGDDLVNDMRMSGSMSAFLALSWNVLLPIGLVTLAVIEYKASNAQQFYYWRGKSNFSYWARKVAGLTQVGFLLLVPVVALVQIYRYMTSGPPDILDRIQLLYRPNENRSSGDGRRGRSAGSSAASRPHDGGSVTNVANLNAPAATEDAPPKYTPPPSYTTATGARLAKLFRQSIRRSVRRLLGEPGRSRPVLSLDTEMNQQSLPPDYSTVRTPSSSRCSTHSGSATSAVAGPSSISETLQIAERAAAPPPAHAQWHDFNELPQPRRPASAPRTLDSRRPRRPYTAADVVTVLGSSSMRVRRAAVRDLPPPLRNAADAPDSTHRNSFRSIENLILNAEPLGQSAYPSPVATATTGSDVSGDGSHDQCSAAETNASVI